MCRYCAKTTIATILTVTAVVATTIALTKSKIERYRRASLDHLVANFNKKWSEHGEGSQEQLLTSDEVRDAISKSKSPVPTWLAELRYAAPWETSGANFEVVSRVVGPEGKVRKIWWIRLKVGLDEVITIRKTDPSVAASWKYTDP